MKVTVFGGTGVVGTFAVAELLKNGHEVTVYARNPQKAPAEWDGKVRVVTGELSDAAAIDSAIAGADAVVSTLGPGPKPADGKLPLIGGVTNIVAAMKKHGVKRLVANNTPTVRDPFEKISWQHAMAYNMARLALNYGFTEVVGESQIIQNSGLDWTIVRFMMPVNGEATGKVKIGFYDKDKLGMKITRADLGAITAQQVDSDRYIGRAPGVSN